MVDIAESRQIRRFLKTDVVILEGVGGALEFHFEKVLVRGEADRFLEALPEMGIGESRFACGGFEIPVLQRFETDGLRDLEDFPVAPALFTRRRALFIELKEETFERVDRAVFADQRELQLNKQFIEDAPKTFGIFDREDRRVLR